VFSVGLRDMRAEVLFRREFSASLYNTTALELFRQVISVGLELCFYGLVPTCYKGQLEATQNSLAAGTKHSILSGIWS
jgi:hypothetical protein